MIKNMHFLYLICVMINVSSQQPPFTAENRKKTIDKVSAMLIDIFVFILN